MITTAYKSEYTGQLFETESEYNSHIKQFKANKIETEKKKDLVSRTERLRQQPRLTATSIEDFRQKAFDTINELNKFGKGKLLGLFFNNYNFGSVGNTHSKPINGVQNWGQEDGNPTSYDGWNGDIVAVLSKDSDDLHRLIDQFPGINTGCGGYRGSEYGGLKGYVLGYGLKLYLDDFPLIKEQYGKYRQLRDNYNKWKVETERLIDTKNNEDFIVSELNSFINAFRDEMKVLNEQLLTTNRRLSEKQLENKNIVLEENKFGELEEMEMIEKELKITNKWKIN